MSSYDAVSRESSAEDDLDSEHEQAALVATDSAAALRDEGKGGRQRLVLGLLGFTMEVICYADRTGSGIYLVRLPFNLSLF